ncbi:metallophosphoesterase [Clostridium tagluense]|uniref:metallophosphoesterase family protein n=1 Tax=Clostridium tagluense TaxID=360422 RepID=UPI001CF47FC0|nr:metallophosphoesterase [Clostridium tagluense]MCB2310435.1 metallophosphoesterase [Clostridium tagluense]MCB2315399.1 metallophosphoesterase [Clostridium tagluense]MCB2320251.1 metallophosphoesterase [Clostridium tagluense]MCB2325141.1 metallophosphoesterase [Clostridium tagluense]MCB2329993.1 metallophosphoesterase [Clostridium tagluense]
MDKITWIHLSDIHYNFNNYETDWLRDLMIELFKKDDIKCDFFVVTGDLLHKNKAGFEDGVFKYLSEISDLLNVSKENIFIVPGNHDFERDKKRRIFIRGLKNPLKDIKNNVSELEQDSIKDLIDGQSQFWNFHQKFLERKSDYYNVHFVDEREDFNIINLNTCLISGDEDEEGSLSINMSKLRETLKKVSHSTKPNIAIAHHSLECFCEEERDEIVQMFDDYGVDLYLCGHMHKNKYIMNTQSSRVINSFVCGANMVDSYAEPTFIKGEIDIETSECSIIYYKWSPKRKEWLIDYDYDRKVSTQGDLSFFLERLKNLKDEKLNKEIEDLTNVEVPQDKFEKFLKDFSKNVKIFDEINIEYKKDVEDKFRNMKCCKTIETEFDSHVEYFTLVDKILADSAFVPYDRKFIIPGVIRQSYYKVLDSSLTGNEIMSKMVELLCNEYKGVVNVPWSELQEYFKTIIYWSINKCDIYNDEK